MQAKNLSISESEWKVMKVLWEKPNLTLKEIAAGLDETDWSYTTIRTLVTRLSEKGAIAADKSQTNNFRYYPAVSESECKFKEVNRFLSRVFDGSVSMLVSTLTKDSNLTEKEQKELMDIIEKIK
ncbi:MAG: BlaI/MecI/CopY family transcriptional regulator [Bacillota bacterium]